MRRALTLLLLLALVLARDAHALDPGKLPSQYLHESWGTADGLPSSTLYSLATDPDGFLWYGTYRGAGWFDGERFRFVDAPRRDGVAVDEVYGVAPLGGGDAWILPNSGPLIRLSTGERIDGGGGGVQLTRDRAGRLWAAQGRAGLFVLDGPRLRRVGTRPAFCIAAAEDGSIWVGSSGELLHLDAAENIAVVPVGVDAPVIDIAIDTDSIWAATSQGPVEIRNGKAVAIDLPGTREVLVDRDRNVWVGTEAGLLRMRDSVPSRFPEDDPLSRMYILDLVEDRDGGIWIAGMGWGLHRIRDTPFRVIGVPEGLAYDYVGPIQEGRDGTMWLATSGSVERLKAGKVETLITEPMEEMVLSGSDVWFVNRETKALSRFDGRTIRRFELPGVKKGRKKDFAGINWMVADDGGDILVSVRGDMVRFRDGVQIRAEDGSPPTAFIGKFRSGKVWVLHDRNAAILGDPVQRLPPVPPALESPWHLYEDGAGRIWAGTYGGIIVLENGRWTSLRETLPAVVIAAFQEDDRGMMWVSTAVGVFRFDPRDALAAHAKGEPASVRWFGQEDGLRSTDCSPESIRTSDGRLWFGTAIGVGIIDPNDESILHNPRPPTIRVLGTQVDGKVVDPSTLPAGTRRFEIEYTASVLPVPKRARFKYRLEGFDDEWFDAGNGRTAVYTNVPPGKYTFRVIAANEDGVWNEEGASIAVRIAPLIWETWLFTLAMSTGALGMVAGGFGLRGRHLRARAADLERQVEDATRLLAVRADEKLARTAQVARFGEFAASVAHNLKTPLTFIRGEMELLDEKRRAGDVPGDILESAIAASLDHCRRMSSEIETGMSFVRPGAAPVVEVDVGMLLREIALLLRSRAVANGTKIEVEIAGRILIRGNLDNLRHAVANLASNSIDAMPQGGVVTLSAGALARGVEIRVSDTGPGVPESVRQKLFHPFVSTKGDQGTGLGLASCRRIVEEEHGGKIRLEPTATGATFVMELPS